MDKKLDEFQALLDDQYTWPSAYLFKFIVPHAELSNLEKLIEGNKLTERPSKNGKYISVTFSAICNSSDEVLAMYTKVSSIPGIISL